MRQWICFLGLTVALFSTLLAGAQSLIREPVAGLIFDRSARQVTPILGILGAARMAEPLDFGFDVLTAEVSPEQDFVLAVRSDLKEALVVNVGRDGISVGAIQGASNDVDQVFLSPLGSSAVLYNRTAGRLQVVAGLPADPAVTREVFLPAAASAALTVAIDDSGSVLLVGFSEENTGSLVLFPDIGPPRIVTSPGTEFAVTFLRGSRDIVVANTAEGEVSLLRDIEFTAQPVLLADRSKGLNRPDSIAIAADNRRVFVGSQESRTVWILPIVPSDHPDEALQTVPCPCAIDGLRAVGRGAVFQISEPSEDPLWVFDGRDDDPRVLFIP